MIIQVLADWHEANERHQFELDLVDEDGALVSFLNDDGEQSPFLNLQQRS